MLREFHCFLVVIETSYDILTLSPTGKQRSPLNSAQGAYPKFYLTFRWCQLQRHGILCQHCSPKIWVRLWKTSKFGIYTWVHQPYMAVLKSAIRIADGGSFYPWKNLGPELQKLAVLWTVVKTTNAGWFFTVVPKTIHRTASVGSFGNMSIELLALAVLIHDSFMDQNCNHQQFWWHFLELPYMAGVPNWIAILSIKW